MLTGDAGIDAQPPLRDRRGICTGIQQHRSHRWYIEAVEVGGDPSEVLQRGAAERSRPIWVTMGRPFVRPLSVLPAP
jgi:hypothetical protein